ncbi:MAG: hypothetical protein IT336_02200 [Thermomicrobiales bacterium]|nr:hypothetical protein [Thermomicrobiales bacterium]
MPIPQTAAHVIVLTDRHVILAELPTFGRRLSDLVNDRLSRQLELENARVNRSDRPDDQLGHYDRLVVKKAHIHAILVISEPVRQTQQRLSTYVPKTPARISALLPVLLISGSVHVAARVDPAVWTLDADGDPFVAITHAQVTLSHRHGPPIPVPVALVNRNRIEATAPLSASAQ